MTDGSKMVHRSTENSFSEKQETSFTRAYSLKHIKKIAEIDNGVLILADGLTESHSTISINSISDLFGFVKQYDKDFHPISVNPALLNDDGTPKKFYHGTPNATFTEFKDWQYFTESKKYADVYQNQGASSNGYKKTADRPDTYEVYLRADKIFDTRNAAERKIFEDEFYMKWGNGAPLSEKGLPDWTDGDDLIEFFEENEYDYDAILLDEGGTGGYGDTVNNRGVSVVIKDSTQIKSATDNIGTFDGTNPDIRYSDRRVDYVAVSEFVNEAMANRGQTKNKHNQHSIAKIPSAIAKAVSRATAGRVNVSNKYFAFEGSKLYHEIKNHSNEKIEKSKGQIAYTESDVDIIVDTMMNPDFIEDISSGDKLDQRNTVAFVKSYSGKMVVVAAIGGRRNPNVVPEEIIWFTEEKWNEYDGMTVKEIIYGRSKKRTFDSKEINEIKKNRVTVVHDESFDSPAPTSKTLLRSPLDDIISNPSENTTDFLKNYQDRFDNEFFELFLD